MGQDGVAILLLCVTAVVVSVTSHAVVRRYALASVVAAVASSLLLQCIAYIEVGYLGPFFLIAFALANAVAFGIALIVGIPFLVCRRKSPPGHCPKCRYNLTGNTSGTCPECGSLVPRPRRVGGGGRIGDGAA